MAHAPTPARPDVRLLGLAALLGVALVTVTLAIGRSGMDLLHVSSAHPAYLVTDLAWPLTMVLTFVISLTALFTRTLPGWGRAALLFCSASLPVTILMGTLHLRPFDTFGPHTALGWGLWGVMLIVLGRALQGTRPPSALAA